MPELPEVETIARGLGRSLVGKTIDSVEIHLPKMAIAPPGIEFASALRGERIMGAGRRGKYVLLHLRSGRTLVTSLRMTGRMLVGDGPVSTARTHIAIHYTDGTRLDFADVRTFGRMRLVDVDDQWDKSLGVEPLSSGFTQDGFMSMLAGRTTPVKALLLDQRHIAGIGNIYACEALWEAGIRPDRPAKALTKPAIRRLYHAIVNVLNRAITLRGTSVDDYVDADGLRGGFQNVLAVYGKLGTPCSRCGAPIVRTVIAQRGTWWCRKCQR